MMTTLLAVGTCPQLQFAPLNQSVLTPPVQVKVRVPTVRLLPLSEPTVAGLSATTRTR